MFKRLFFLSSAALMLASPALPAQAQQVDTDVKHHGDTEICITLYEQCRNRTNNGYKCGVCLIRCQASSGNWPFELCPFPRGLRGTEAKDAQKCSPLLSGLAQTAQ